MTEYTTFRIDQHTLEKLRQVAEALERSMAAQVRFWVDREYEELAECGFIQEDQRKQVREKE